MIQHNFGFERKLSMIHIFPNRVEGSANKNVSDYVYVLMYRPGILVIKCKHTIIARPVFTHFHCSFGKPVVEPRSPAGGASLGSGWSDRPPWCMADCQLAGQSHPSCLRSRSGADPACRPTVQNSLKTYLSLWWRQPGRVGNLQKPLLSHWFNEFCGPAENRYRT